MNIRRTGTLIIVRQSAAAILCLWIFLFTSCNVDTEYPGFSRTTSGIHYRLNVIGNGGPSPSSGDYITVDLKYSTVNDSVFFSERRKFRLDDPSYRGSVEECFMMMNAGDQADFIIKAYDFFLVTLGINPPGFFSDTEDILISVNMIEIQSEKEYQNEKEAFLAWIEDLGRYEKTRLHQFMQEEKPDAEPDIKGFYRVIIEDGTGKKVEAGDTVDVHYEGRFLYGRYFDSTRNRDEPFQFIYGEEMQLIAGLEIAIGNMREGEKSLILLPSELAFGRQGSSGGIIPPYTSLIFEVEVLRVR